MASRLATPIRWLTNLGGGYDKPRLMGVASHLSRWYKNNDKHLLNGMILQVPTHVFPIWIGYTSRMLPGLPVTRIASFARMEQSLAHFVSCICYHALQGAFGGIFVAKMTSVSFTVRGGFHSLKVSKLKIHSILGELVEYTYMIRRDII